MKDTRNRLFKCDNGKTYVAYYGGCLACEHCTDIFWDYTNGPYAFVCELNKECKELPCDFFEVDESLEITDK